MAIICSEINLLYFCVAKAGSTSISNMLIKFFHGKFIPENHIWNLENEQILVDRKHSTLQELLKYNILTVDYLKNFHILINARNPFDWVLSDYLFKLQCHDIYLKGDAPDWITSRADMLSKTASMKFNEHIFYTYRNKKCSVFQKYIDGLENIAGIDFDIVKIEQINDDFQKVAKKLGIKKYPSIGHENSTQAKKDNYRMYYSNESRSIIEKSFANDLTLLEYEF